MEFIRKYFPNLETTQIEKLENLHLVYKDWNQKINLISRKDFSFFYERHVLHSLAIAKVFSFSAGSKIMDAGTGGGFPGIPLSIFFPEVTFHLVDSIGKKIKAVESIARELDLKNVSTENNRLENVNQKFDYIVSRAVAPLPEIIRWTGDKLLPVKDTAFKPGIIYLKGGEVHTELLRVSWKYRIIPIRELFTGEFFDTKLVVYLYR